jgi:hypothetical protein
MRGWQVNAAFVRDRPQTKASDSKNHRETNSETQLMHVYDLRASKIIVASI